MKQKSKEKRTFMSREPSNTDTKKFVGWAEIEHCADLLLDRLKRKNIQIDMIVGIERGGLIPASIISYKLKLPMVSVNTDGITKSNLMISRKNILVIDDINDTGTTLKDIIPKINQYCDKVSIGVFYEKEHTEYNNKDCFYGIKIPSDWWIVFPWEKEEYKNIWSK